MVEWTLGKEPGGGSLDLILQLIDLRGVASSVPAERKSPRNLWRWPPRKIAGRGGALIVLEEKHGPIREVSACREAGTHSRTDTRGRRPRPTTRVDGAETDQGPFLPCGAVAARDLLLHRRAPLGAGSPGPRGAAAARQHPCAPHPKAAGKGSTRAPGPPPRAGDPPSTRHWEGSASRAFLSRQGWASRHLRPLRSGELEGTWRGLGGAMVGGGSHGELGGKTEPAELPSPPRLAATLEGPTPTADRWEPRRGPTGPRISSSHWQTRGASTIAGAADALRCPGDVQEERPAVSGNPASLNVWG
uniref:Translation initiation factor IF-2-like n=1 Tax=Camelus bactrianus TaxID=9837 RepID=A0A9W3FMR4_CAMBA|nr:translation initiation factor IF-2-like [Camelus bactrianus]